MNFVGIDPGIAGGLALLDSGGRVLELADMPSEKKGIVGGQIATWLRDMGSTYGEVAVAIERTSVMPKQGICSALTIGLNAGVIHGVLIALGLPWTIVHARQWSGYCHQGVSGGALTTKQKSLIAAQRIWPAQVWPTFPRSGKTKDGPIDAALIAHWARIHRWQQKTVDSPANAGTVKQ